MLPERATFPDGGNGVEAGVLEMTAAVTNTGEDVMPAAFGFHPALRWPLPYGKPRALP